MARSQVPSGLTAVGNASVALLATQVQALLDIARERELTASEKGWAERVCTLVREEMRVRGALIVELRKLGQDVAVLAAMFNGEQQPQLAAPTGEASK